MEQDRWAEGPAPVGAWASAGREAFLHSEAQAPTEPAGAVPLGVVAVAALGEEVVVGAGEVGGTAIPGICPHTAIRGTRRPILQPTVTLP
jgi:hypothetical protein